MGKNWRKGTFEGLTKECISCKSEFYVEKHRINTAKYCSRECQHKGFEVKRIVLECGLSDCSNTLHRTQKEIDKGNGNFFCSVQCSSIHGRRIIQKSPPKNRRTKPELEFMKLLEELKLEYVFQKPLQWKRGWKKWYDFYLPKYNTLIEVDGTYWHGKDVKVLNEQQQNTRDNDILKNELAKEQGFELIRVWSDEIKMFNKNKLIKL